MFVYLGVYATLSFLAIQQHRSDYKLYFVLAWGFLIWFMGFRFETGCDYSGYLNRWNAHDFQVEGEGSSLGSEVGFTYLIDLVKAAGLNYTWLNVLASTILASCYIAFARAHRYSALILVLLFPVVMVQLGMSGIRQAIAGGFLMLAFNAYMRERKLMTAAWILLGLQFHVSVIIFLPLSLIAGRSFNVVKLAIALVIAVPVAALLVGDRTDTYVDRYADGTVTSVGAVIRYTLVAMPVFLFWRYREKTKSLFPEVYPLLVISSLMIVSLSPLIVLSSIMLHRLNYYVMPASILILVYVGALLFNQRTTGHLLAILIYGTYSLFWFSTSSHAERCYLPYDNTYFYSADPLNP